MGEDINLNLMRFVAKDGAYVTDQKQAELFMRGLADAGVPRTEVTGLDVIQGLEIRTHPYVPKGLCALVTESQVRVIRFAEEDGG